jgi:anti-anti-sigma regulatory factor
LLNPQPRIAQALELAGVQQLFEIYQDLKLAVASY